MTEERKKKKAPVARARMVTIRMRQEEHDFLMDPMSYPAWFRTMMSRTMLRCTDVHRHFLITTQIMEMERAKYEAKYREMWEAQTNLLEAIHGQLATIGTKATPPAAPTSWPDLPGRTPAPPEPIKQQVELARGLPAGILQEDIDNWLRGAIKQLGQGRAQQIQDAIAIYVDRCKANGEAGVRPVESIVSLVMRASGAPMGMAQDELDNPWVYAEDPPPPPPGVDE